MKPEYKILRMKDLAQKLELKEAGSFRRSEEYLEYAIKEINDKAKYNWHQYLFLIDILYVVLVSKASVQSQAAGYGYVAEARERSNPPDQEMISNPVPSEEELDEEIPQTKITRTKLKW